MKLDLRLLNVKDFFAGNDISDHGVLLQHAELSDGNHLTGLLRFSNLLLEYVPLHINQL
jgi:hypothetical protein